MIHIYTENLCRVPRIKNRIKYLLDRNDRGPRAVADSLARGLRELNESITLNKNPKEPFETACVLSGTCALRRMIEWRRKGLIKKIIAGPNITVFPDDANAIMCDPAIDVIVVPAQWVKDLWASLRPELESRIVVWAAGVQDPGERSIAERNGFLIYKKHVSAEIFDMVIAHLDERHILYTVLEYGSFEQTGYFALLEKVEGVVYLTESESQGLALAEAWMRDVPTLVWDRELFQGGGREWKGASSAPYLTDACGMRFKHGGEFGNIFGHFKENIKTFRPREYALEHFTDKRSAEQYLSIIKQ